MLWTLWSFTDIFVLFWSNNWVEIYYTWNNLNSVLFIYFTWLQNFVISKNDENEIVYNMCSAILTSISIKAQKHLRYWHKFVASFVMVLLHGFKSNRMFTFLCFEILYMLFLLFVTGKRLFIEQVVLEL